MGMLPPEEAAPPAAGVRAETPKRVEAPAAPASRSEQDELAAALEEMEAEQVQEQQRKAGR
jgi:phage shock protein A